MKRISAAIWIRPSVSVGRIAWRRRESGSASRPYSASPEGGRIGSASENRRMSMMPSQKLGNDTPNSETAEPSVSHTVPRRTAATTPSGTATARARTSAAAGELQRRPQPLGDQPGHGIAGLERAPEVATQRGTGPRHVLQRQRAIEAEAAPDLRGGVGRELTADQHGFRPARGQAHEGEEDHRDADQHEHGEAQPTQDVGAQARLHAATSRRAR